MNTRNLIIFGTVFGDLRIEALLIMCKIRIFTVCMKSHPGMVTKNSTINVRCSLFECPDCKSQFISNINLS